MSCTLCNDTFRVRHGMVWRKCRCQIPTKQYKQTMARSSLSAWTGWKWEVARSVPFGLTSAISTARRAGISDVEIADLTHLPLSVVTRID